MHRLYLSLLIILFGGLAYAGGGSAGDVFTYQGRLQDNNTNANGDYEILFELWTIANTAVMLDSATLVVTVNDGLFNAELPFGDTLGGTDPVELEIGVRPFGSMDPFTVLPRQRVRHAPLATVAERGASAFEIGIANDASGSLSIFNGSSATFGLSVTPFNSSHSLRMSDRNGTTTFFAEPDSDGSGHYVEFVGEGGELRFDGNSGDGPTLTLGTGGSSARFAPATAVVDNRVILPAGSVNSAEIGDEPGVASQSSAPFSAFLSTTDTALAAQTIDCPADGYIIAMANIGMGSFGTTVEVQNSFSLSIDGTNPYLGEEGVQIIQHDNFSSADYHTVSTTKVIPVTAGMTTVTLLGRTNVDGAGFYGRPLDLTLLYVPTAYGATLSRGAPAGAGASLPLAGAAAIPATPDPVPYDVVNRAQRELESQIAELRAEMAEIRARQEAGR